MGLYDPEQDQFVTVTKIGTGLSDEQWRSIRERTKGLEVDHRPARVSSLIEPSVWVEPQLVIEVLADEITRSPSMEPRTLTATADQRRFIDLWTREYMYFCKKRPVLKGTGTIFPCLP